MPSLTKKGKFHPDTDEIVLEFSFDCTTPAEGFDGIAYTRVRSERFTKHVHWLDDYSIVPRGAKHTAIQPESITFMRSLYESFSRDLVREFVADGSAPIWLELAYKRLELKVPLRGIDVAAKGAALTSYQQVVVGANVSKLGAHLVHQSPRRDPQTGSITVVNINHGPYAC